MKKLNGFKFKENELYIKWGKPVGIANQYFVYDGRNMKKHFTAQSDLPFSAYPLNSVKDFNSISPFVYEDNYSSDSEPEFDYNDSEDEDRKR